ncbi:MAG: carboxypeptidase regulatory-like domain-containing protein [Acidobacteria bacterium]|nr:carboxypeptidase regulatory-like domain-containing protein [Acidobacteriota bacterium]
MRILRSKGTAKVVFTALTLVGAIAISSSRAAENHGVIAGMIQDGAGKAVGGAIVQVKNTDRGLTVTVISQGNGRYQAESLPPGKYTVQGLGGGLQTDLQPSVEVSGGKTLAVNLTLKTPQNFKNAVTNPHYAAVMPEGEGKTIIVSLCTDCHQRGLEEVVTARWDRNGWMETVRRMENNPYGSVRSLDIRDGQRETVIEYLAKHFGAGAPPLDPVRVLPKTWVQGAAAKSVVTEYDLPSGAAPHDVAVDSQGVGWINESGGVIGRFDPRTLTYSRFPLPGGKSGATAIAVDPQDRVWVYDSTNSRFVQYDPKTEAFSVYPVPKSTVGRSSVNTMRFHPDGKVWATGQPANRILHLDPPTKEVAQYPVPAGIAAKRDANPYGMAIDAKGMVWYLERYMNKVARIDPKTGQTTEYDIPTPESNPRRMATDVEGNIWFGESGGVGKLGMINTRTAKITEYPTPTKYSGAYSVDIDRKRNLIWVMEMLADQIACFDPRTTGWVEYPIPTHFSSVRRIEADPSRPSRVWFAGFYVDKVGFLDVIE